MPPKKSVIIAPSLNQIANDVKDAEETEVAATIVVPGDPCWGWVVVAASFTSIAILDGVAYTFGSILGDMSLDLQMGMSLITMLNSTAVALYFMAGPLVAALINRFGFRAIAMVGSVICSLSLCVTSLISSYPALILTYGCFTGFGFALVNMAACLVTGFYFEKLRSLALAITTSGSSVGVMLGYPLNSYLVKLAGWRSTMLLHSGMFGMIYFFSMAYRPLLALNITKTPTTQDPTKTVTYLPNLSTPVLKPSEPTSNEFKSTRAERLFQAVQNTNYPTAAAVVEDTEASTSKEPTQGTAAVSKLTITAVSPKGGVTQKQLNQVKSMVSKGRLDDQIPTNVEIKIEAVPEEVGGCCGSLCHWHDHIPESRPMYRDDAFYTGKVEKLPEYQKSRAGVESGREEETGLEYQLAVTRATAASDLAENRGVFTTAVRRVLATMMDTNLLKRKSYLIICISGFLTYLGYLVPFVFIQTRNLANGVDPIHCDLFVSVIGGSNAIGRITLGALAVKVDPVKIFAFTSCVAGAVTIASCASYDIYFQYGYCFVFGYCISSRVCLGSIVLVALYGLEKLTNATGMMLLFQGFGCLFSTPLSSILQSSYGDVTAFVVAGSFIVLGGLLIFPVKCMAEKEETALAPRSMPITPQINNEPAGERRPSLPPVIQKPVTPPPPPSPPTRQPNPFRRK